MDIRENTKTRPQPEGLRQQLQQLEKVGGRKAFMIQASSASVDSAILAFFLLGPYLRNSPSYLVIDHTWQSEAPDRHSKH